MAVLPWLGALGCGVFVATFVVDGWTRPGYRPVRHGVSALALGPRGWLQTGNFLVCGLAVTAGAAALPGALGSVPLGVMVGVFGLGLVASAVFPMDPMRGYPPGAPEGTPARTSARHRMHEHAGTVVFGSLPVTATVAAFALPGVGWTWYSALTGAATLTGLLVFGEAWQQDDPRVGLLQRLTILVGWTGLGALFVHAARLAS